MKLYDRESKIFFKKGEKKEEQENRERRKEGEGKERKLKNDPK